eukprot:3425190-Rhodomonas_salina.1
MTQAHDAEGIKSEGTTLVGHLFDSAAVLKWAAEGNSESPVSQDSFVAIADGLDSIDKSFRSGKSIRGQ